MNKTEEKAMRLLDQGYHRDDVANVTGLSLSEIARIELILEEDSYDDQWDAFDSPQRFGDDELALLDW